MGHAETPLVLNKFTLYETRTRFYIVGSNQSDERFRVLKIDRTSGNELNVIDDEVVYSKQEITELLGMIENGNKSSGGLHKVVSFFGIVGFIRFLEGYYIILITKRSAVALIGGHYIYHIDDTMLISVPGPGAKLERKPDEARYLQVFSQVDLSKNFYFSYTYDITRTLQWNMSHPGERQYSEMFVWNNYLLQAGFDSFRSNWALPIIHGFVDQSKISVFGRNIFVTLIARRSRFFAGARFLKRGVNDQGYVANDVETEQIVSDATTTSFYFPPGRYGNKPGYTSFVQHRGSIPLFWSQETAAMVAKPPIELNVIDPFFSAAALHFDNMLQRYGGPIIVLNLVKSKEKNRRESILLDEFTESVTYLNQFLPSDKKIKYIAWDMARASKSHDQDVIGVLEDLAEQVLSTTGFFHSGPEPYTNALRRAKVSGEDTPVNRILGRRQHGVVRTNCIDCLDRTNAAQFVIGKCALGHQLYALGVLAHPSVPFDSDAVNLLNAMYHDHGDTIALQYGGSHLVNTMETYRKISPWTSHSRDMIESIRRYYSNSFTDAEKQDAINLFLGHFVPNEQGHPSLWDLITDYYLHNEDPRRKKPKRSYAHWFTPEAVSHLDGHSDQMRIFIHEDGYYAEYYRPKLYTSFARLFAFNIINTSTRLPSKDDISDHSPFTVRVNPAQANRYLMIYRYRILDSRALQGAGSSRTSGHRFTDIRLAKTPLSLNIGGVRRWLKLANQHREVPVDSGRITEITEREERKKDKGSHVKEATTPWWTTSALASRLLDPQVPGSELKEYKRYIHQFKPSSTLLLPTVEQAPTVQVSHPDYAIFAEFVGRSGIPATTGQPMDHFEVDSRDEDLYKAYIKSGETSHYMGPSVQKADVPRYDAYQKWLSTGKFVISRSKTVKAA